MLGNSWREKALDDLLTKMNLNSKTQVVAASADGASVNFGSNIQVLARFQHECMLII